MWERRNPGPGWCPIYKSALLHSTQSLWKEASIASMGSRTFTDLFFHVVQESTSRHCRSLCLPSKGFPGDRIIGCCSRWPRGPCWEKPIRPALVSLVSGERAQRKAIHCFHVDSVSSSSVARFLGFPVDDGGALSPLRLGLCLCPQGNPALGLFHLFFYCMLVLLKCILHSTYTCTKPVNLKCIQCCISIVSQQN